MTRLRGGFVAALAALPMAIGTVALADAPPTIDGQYSAAGALGPGAQTTMTVLGRGGVPSTGVGSVALNITVTEPTASSYLTVWPSGTTRPLASSLNFTAGETVANSVITKVGADGKIAIFNLTGYTHVVIDAVGWFPDNQSFVGVVPARLADSRDYATADGGYTNIGPIPQTGSTNIKVVGRGGVPSTGAGAVALNVTVTNPTLPSYLTVWPTGAPRPLASNLNFGTDETVPNMVIAKIGDGGQVSFYNNTGNVDLVVDVVGWFPSGSAFNSLVPSRLLDTRLGTALAAGSAMSVQIAGAATGPPSNAGSVVLNVTVTNPSVPSYLTVWPTGSSRPLSSNLNFVARQTVPNLVLVKVGTGGSVSLFSPSRADVIVDVLGWFPNGGSFTGVVPARLMDTRRAGGAVQALTPGTSWQWQLSGPIDETVLDGVSNPKKMYDIDLFNADASTIERLHAKGIYVVCYVETGGWEDYRPDAGSYPASVLGSAVAGFPNERLVDIRQIAVLQPIIAARLNSAKSKGCDGIEPDLDDTYNGYDSGFPLTMQDQLAFNHAVADLAHARGMSIGLKNGASPGGAFEAAMVQFTDWALNEECNRFGECGGYQVYVNADKAVFQVEYTASGATVAAVCPPDNAANFDGLLKLSSQTLSAAPRAACRMG